MKDTVVPLTVVLFLFLAIDLPVILWVNASLYEKQFERINKTQHKSGRHVWYSAAIVYLLMTLGLYVFVVKPNLEELKSDNVTTFLKGALFGLIVFGVYNGSNKATINEWGTKESIIDSGWGTLLNGIVALNAVHLSKFLLTGL
jgi:hypothetical protein